jgi:uncharacterized protein YchJ
MPIPAIHGTARWFDGDHDAMRDYLAAHESLPGQPEALPEQELGALAAQLHDRRAGTEERKRLLVFLAHHGSERAVVELQRFVDRAGPELRRFAELALDEALQISGSASRRLGRSDPCPCGSGRKFKDCCARRLS